jgi:hypothetical protein
MTTTTFPPLSPGAPSNLLHSAWAYNRWITLAGLLHLALIPVFLIAWAIDPQTILGAPAWIKPLKFAISGAIYCFTFVWLLTYVQGYPRLKRFMASTTGLAMVVETVLIALQVARGTTSHFNYTTPFDAAVFKTMGAFVMLLVVLNLVLVILLLLQRLPDQVFAASLRLGVLISLVGMAVAFLMTNGPTPAQLEQLEAGAAITTIGAHSIGVEDGGPGLPLLGWSTTGGDLRVPHFFGLHGMQLLPLLGWLLTQPALHRRLTNGGRLTLVWTGGLGYLALVTILTWQALRGQSIIAPDGLTWLALGLLVGIVAVVTGVTWMRKL